MNACRVLIIDTDTTSLKFLAHAIKQAGFEVYAANTGKEGLIAAWQERPHVIIIEPMNLSDLTIDEMVNKLRSDQRTAHRHLVAFTKLSNPQEIQQVQSLAFNTFLPKGPESLPKLLDLLEQVKALKDSSPKADRPRSKKQLAQTHRGLVVAFISAKGGVGTSSACANVAEEVAKLAPDEKVVVVDLVLPIGSIASIAGYDGEVNLYQIAALPEGEVTPDYLQTTLPMFEQWHFQLLPGCPDPSAAQELDVTRIPDLLEALKQAYDFVFVDIGRALSRISLPFILKADQVVFVLGPDEATVSLTQKTLDFLRNLGLLNVQIYMLLNRAVGLEGLGTSQIEESLKINVAAAIPHIGREFVLANNFNQPVTVRLPNDTVAFALRQIAQEVRTRAINVLEKGLKSA